MPTENPARSHPRRRAEPAEPRVLVADDQADVLQALRLLLKSEGFSVGLASAPAEVLDAVRREDHDVLLIDLNYARDTTSGREGLDLLQQLQALDPTLPVVVMTAWGSVEVAVEAMRRGARDFVEKPWDNARLVSILRTQAELGGALRRSLRLEEENRVLRGDAAADLVAASRAMRPVLDVIERVGPSDANVLLTGENGTGKSLLARVIHAVSRRSQRALVSVNAGSLAEGVFESELFGHVKGSFTDARQDRVGRFEMADGGTLFLDEIANVPLAQQSKLLRVLETGELERVGCSKTRRVDVRVLSATNADLPVEVANGRFRRDLLYRLNTVEIPLPPLRERGEDIPLLAVQFLERHGRRYRKNLAGFTPAAMEVMRSHAWPGNVRELDHAVERGVLMSRGEWVESADLGIAAQGEAAALAPTAQEPAPAPDLEGLTLDEAEKRLIQQALTTHQGNVKQAARALGVSRSALYRRLERHGL